MAMTYGAYAGVAMIIITYFFSLGGNLFTSASGFFCNLVLIVALSIGTRKYRDVLLGGYANYGTVLEMGTLISLFAAILYMFFNYVLLKYIDKDLIYQFFRVAEEAMLMQGRMDEEVETMLDILKQNIKAVIFVYAFFKFLQYLFVGFLFTLVIAIFVKRDGDPFKQDMQSIE